MFSLPCTPPPLQVECSGRGCPLPGARLGLEQWEKAAWDSLCGAVSSSWGSSGQGCSWRLPTSSSFPSSFLLRQPGCRDVTQPGSSRGEAALGDLPRSGKSGGEQLELKGSRSDLWVNRSKYFTVTPCESKHHGLQSSGWPGPGFPALPGAPEVQISLLLLPLDFSASSPPLPREQSLREPLGVRLLHLPAAHLDRHCQEELCHAGGAVLGLGACHHCHGHQQVGLALSLSPNTAWLCVLAPALTSRVSPCSVGGLILDRTVSDPNFAGMAVFTPVINGESWGCSS